MGKAKETTTAAVVNRCRNWQIAAFAMNNSATNMYMILMGYVSYYANGVAGLGIAFVSTLLTAMRIFDGITDPIIGLFIDKTNGKLGKFRPFMIAGNVILAASVCLIFFCTHLVPEGIFRILFFIAVYLLYIIGYTFQTACTKSGQTVLTSDPKQRPLFTTFDILGMLVFMMGINMYVSIGLVGRHGSLNSFGLFVELVPTIIIISAVLTVIALAGIWKKDRKEFFGLGNAAKEEKVKIKDYLDVIKHNKAIQMLIIAASTDKLAMQVAMNTTVMAMVYGIIIGNYGLSSIMGAVSMLIALPFIFFGVALARKKGSKKALVTGSIGAIGAFACLAVLLMFIQPGDISLEKIGLKAILFLIFYGVGYGCYMIPGNIVIPMIADCSDYETYRSGRYVPGMMGTLFSFVDKMVSSLSATIVGFSVMAIGFKDKLPDVGDALTPEIRILGIFLLCGLPILAWLASLVAMKFYPLNGEKMKEVQAAIAEKKAQA